MFQHGKKKRIRDASDEELNMQFATAARAGKINDALMTLMACCLITGVGGGRLGIGPGLLSSPDSLLQKSLVTGGIIEVMRAAVGAGGRLVVGCSSAPDLMWLLRPQADVS